MKTLIEAITDCGDLAILLPVAGVLTAWTAVIGKPGIFKGWLAALALCIGGTAVLKIYFFACPALSGLHNPSGHTSFSLLVYGTLTLAVANALNDWRRWLVIVAGAIFIAAIGASRIILHDHTVPEVAFGSLLGLSALFLFARAYLRDTPRETHLAPVITASMLLMILLNGHELRAEEFLHSIANYFDISNSCTAPAQ